MAVALDNGKHSTSFKLTPDELAFMMSLCSMTLRGWEDDLRHDRDLNPAPFNALDPSIRRELEDRGAGGSGGMSFGGGGSSGGGGAGSSW